jgi:hypothetical protein
MPVKYHLRGDLHMHMPRRFAKKKVVLLNPLSNSYFYNLECRFVKGQPLFSESLFCTDFGTRGALPKEEVYKMR